MLLREANYWLDTVDMPVPDWERPLPARADVAVIGAGFTGLSAARVLAKRGVSVVVLDAESIGWGASSRNGGMVLTGLKVGAAELIQRYGRDLARRLFAASLAAIDTVERLVAEEQIACNFARTGHLEVAAKPAHYAGFQRSAEAIEREFGHPARLLPRADLAAEIASDRYFGGLVDAVSAGVNPARYLAGLARAAQRAGAQLFEQARVTTLERSGPAYRLTTARGPLEAAQVLIATSGYTGRAMQPLARPLTRRLVPIGSYIIATAPLAPDLAQALIPRGRMVFDSKNFLAYYRLTPDHRMLFGGRARFLPESPATVLQSAAILRRAMVQVFPHLASAEIAYAWGGTLDFAFDLMPHAGRQDGVWYSLGYAGHGVALATYLGTLLGDVIAGETRDNPFAELPFPGAPLGLYDGRPWFLPLAGAYYRFLDLIS
ncbi:MAG: FAD-binding oxidoreductase [Anaerolineales bacterium]|nr:FAD-binding oxidoreductase [Anaerolineales bacterium]